MRRYLRPQVLLVSLELGSSGLGSLGNVAGHLLLASLELLDAGLELLNLLPHACDIVRHRAERRRRLDRGDGGRCDAFRRGLSWRSGLWRCWARSSCLDGRWGRLRRERRFFQRQE